MTPTPAAGPLIRIGELSRRAGVSIDRLRAWERRYGLLRPVRTAGGFRLYTASDERRLRAMQSHLEAGLSAAEAAAAALAAETSLASAAAARPEQLRAELRDALAAFDAARAHAAVDALFAEIGPVEAIRTIIFPFLRDLGERWARGEVTVGEEHFASGLLQARLLGLLQARTPDAGEMALLAAPPGELHTLGLVGFGIALRDRGWRSTYLGADTPIAEVQRVARQIAPAVVVISAVTAARFVDVQDELRDLAAQVPLALAGAGAGALLTQQVGALLLEGDPAEAADTIARSNR